MDYIEIRQPTAAVKRLDAPPYTSTSYYRKNKLQVKLCDSSVEIPTYKFKIPDLSSDDEQK